MGFKVRSSPDGTNILRTNICSIPRPQICWVNPTVFICILPKLLLKYSELREQQPPTLPPRRSSKRPEAIGRQPTSSARNARDIYLHNHCLPKENFEFAFSLFKLIITGINSSISVLSSREERHKPPRISPARKL